MAKTAGPKPVTPLPDPKEWKWCKHEVCKDKVEKLLKEEFHRDVTVVMKESPHLCAVFDEDYCWEHLPEKAKTKYTEKIAEWVKEGRSLERANLYRANLRKAELKGTKLQKANLMRGKLQEANLWGSDLQEADLSYANLQKADLSYANLQKAKLSGANLQETDLRGANLQKANLCTAYLQKAYLWAANLQEADLSYANLQKADLDHANLQEANLSGTNLQEANLYGAELQGATLSDADLQSAFLSGADFQEAHLDHANLQKAHLIMANCQKADLVVTNLQEAELSRAKLQGACMAWCLLNDVQNFTWEQIDKVGEENNKEWRDAQDAYLRLKNYFHQQGRYGDEAKAYYREKLMAKNEAHENLCGAGLDRRILRNKLRSHKGLREYAREAKHLKFRYLAWIIVFVAYLKQLGENYASFFSPNENKGVRRRWLGLWFLWALAGFGEKWQRTICWAAGTFAFFGLLHWLGTNVGWWVLLSRKGEIKHLLDCLYFSLVTFVTLGFEDIWPEAWGVKVIVGIEVVFGYVFLGMIVTLIARKMGR